jgi:hypothetical protein
MAGSSAQSVADLSLVNGAADNWRVGTDQLSTARHSTVLRWAQAVAAGVVMYLAFAVVWLLIGSFLFTGWALWTSGVATDSPAIADPEPLSWPGTLLITTVALVTAAFAVRGFIDLSRRWRQRTREL